MLFCCNSKKIEKAVADDCSCRVVDKNKDDNDDLTYILPPLERWTPIDGNVITTIVVPPSPCSSSNCTAASAAAADTNSRNTMSTTGTIQPAFIPLGKQPEQYTPKGRVLMKEYVYNKQLEGWCHLTTREAWSALSKKAKQRSEKVIFMSAIPVLLPFIGYFVYKQSKYERYYKLSNRRAGMKTPNAVPKHTHPEKYAKYYASDDGRWIVSHSIRTHLNR